MLFGAVCGCQIPAALERAASSAPSGSAPNMRIDGFTPRDAMQNPDSNPPPPTGTTTASSSGTSSRSSSAAVPCPAITWT